MHYQWRIKTMLNIKKSAYGNYSSGNYGAHCMRIDVGLLSLWFSYDTVVAYQDGHWQLHVSENCWGPTTGKHLNLIDSGEKTNRMKRADFETALEAVLKAHGLSI
jgi:hypothetical protein